MEPVQNYNKTGNCPVCNMRVDNGNYFVEYSWKTLYFCSEGCLHKFKIQPWNFFGDHQFELIIIGGGPAGLTAAVYASVSRINTFFIANDIGGQAIDSTKVRNYMGFDFITGKMLVDKFRDQFLEKHFLSHKIDVVTRIKKQNEKFVITTKSKQTFYSKAVIVATGMKKRKLGITGEDRLQRKGIFYKSVQDLNLLDGKDVVVVGGGNSALQTASELQNNNCNVTIVTQGKLIADKTDVEKISQLPNMHLIEEHDVTEILGEDKVKGISIRPEQDREKDPVVISCQAVFIQVGFLPNTEFCRDLVELNRNGEIKINADCSTSTEGIYACGDVTDAYGKRIIIASGEGAKAVLSASQFLKTSKETSKNLTNY
ncbi:MULTISPECIES: FAD-dependent oxidoreductase [Marinilabilia]|uniref:Alkyl hydroperoxide reductase subunit F n=1 Tax=Marinilabilia salmonicolor TaxID=989 RepID=A0A368VD14_9BACT|nr:MULTISPECIES: FAD-dependent oxidoreductase [Marinilabilia]RCW39079.1 alkyl hydroperoxide reductase subunit F [Marinilabilia salmonicolor]